MTKIYVSSIIIKMTTEGLISRFMTILNVKRSTRKDASIKIALLRIIKFSSFIILAVTKASSVKLMKFLEKMPPTQIIKRILNLFALMENFAPLRMMTHKFPFN